MSLETRVSEALEAWCGEEPADFTISLEDLWILHRDEPFDPDGIEQLIQKLESEFSNPPSLMVTATPDDFRAGGKIRTVQQLISEAAAFPEGEADVPPPRKAAKKRKPVKAARKRRTAKSRAKPRK